MTTLASCLEQVAGYTPEDVGDLRRDIDPEWIEAALQATGTATLRRRRLPAESVIWLIIGMALLRRRSIVEVAAKLDLALPGKKLVAAPSSIAQARDRVGPEPLAWLFDRTANHWAHASAANDRWRGLAVYSLDGTKMWVPDTAENNAGFAKHEAGPGKSAFPMVRLVALMALRSHLIAAANFGSYDISENVYAASLWDLVPANSLVIVDRGYFSAATLMTCASTGGRHWLIRGKANLSCRVAKRLGSNDALVEMKLTDEARAALKTSARTWMARRIQYQRKGFRAQVLLTSLVEADLFPASEIVDLYHERWEIELGYDEAKTELLSATRVLRSKSPALISQEIWGVLLAYNLVRLEMESVAAEAKVPPNRISFSAALHYICDEWLWCAVASPGAIPRHLRDLRQQLVGLVLPPRRAERLYPRAVEVQRSNYPVNRRSPSRKRPK